MFQVTWSARDLDGFEAYVRSRALAHLRTALLLTGHRSDAEDLVQTVLAKLAVSWAKTRHVESLDAYVRRSLVNAHLSNRRLKRVRTVPIRELRESPSGAGDDHEDRLMLLGALQRLPARQRAVIVLRFYEDLTERETAQALGCSVGTVKSQTFKALNHLRSDTGLDLNASPHQEAGTA